MDSQHQPEKNKWRWLQLQPCQWYLFGSGELLLCIVVYFCLSVHLLYSAHETKSYRKCQVFALVPLASTVSLPTEDHLYTNRGINFTSVFPIPIKPRCVCKGLGWPQLSSFPGVFVVVLRLKGSPRKKNGSLLVNIFSRNKHDYGFISLVT